MIQAEQIDWVSTDTSLPIVSVGSWVRTNYGTGPYQILDMEGPCRCPEYLGSLQGDETPSEEHYHMTCSGEAGIYWLNGYRLNGISVWGDDRLERAH